MLEVGVAVDAREQWTGGSAFRMLLVENNDELARRLAGVFASEGFTVKVARDGRDALDQFERDRPGIVVTEMLLPRVSGLDLCRQIRRTSAVPLVFLSAEFTEMDVVLALEIGADDYVCKPFRTRELVARVRTAHRRELNRRRPEPVVSVGVFEYDGLKIDIERHQVTVDGVPIPLARKEFGILSVLLSNPDRAISRDALVSSVWGVDYHGGKKSLDVHVKRIRRKIEVGSNPARRIVTIRGHGYQFRPNGITGEPDVTELAEA